MTESAIASGYAGTDQDFQWAVAMASFAEILKQSSYADPAGIDSYIHRPSGIPAATAPFARSGRSPR